MRPHRVVMTALVCVSPLLLGACSTIVPIRAAARPSPETRVSAVAGVPDAGRSERQSAISVAGSAAAAAQTHATDTTPTVVIPEPPRTPPAHAEIPRDERPVSNPGPRWETAAKNADFSSDGLTRITSHITRTLAAFGRSVRQLVSDIR